MNEESEQANIDSAPEPRISVKRSHSHEGTFPVRQSDDPIGSSGDEQEVQFLEAKRLKVNSKMPMMTSTQIEFEHSSIGCHDNNNRSASSSPNSVVLIKEVTACGQHQAGSSSSGMVEATGSNTAATVLDESSDSDDDCLYNLDLLEPGGVAAVEDELGAVECTDTIANQVSFFLFKWELEIDSIIYSFSRSLLKSVIRVLLRRFSLTTLGRIREC